MPPPSATVRALGRSNAAILRQKLDLIDLLSSKFGRETAKELYAAECPIVNASVGQHIRHSVDHMEKVAQIMKENELRKKMHYDIRDRGGGDEHDMDIASDRISKVMHDLVSYVDNAALETDTPVTACFMLSSDGKEFDLNSTIERELGFAAHHAIHHMALIRIIATNTLCLSPSDLSPEFGRAPSTAAYDNTQSSSKNL